jgi:hypothetical protein
VEIYYQMSIEEQVGLDTLGSRAVATRLVIITWVATILDSGQNQNLNLAAEKYIMASMMNHE